MTDTYEEFKKLFLCEFSMDDKDTDLYKKIIQYYKDTNNISNKHALTYHLRLMKWLKSMNYSPAEIRYVKNLALKQLKKHENYNE